MATAYANAAFVSASQRPSWTAPGSASGRSLFGDVVLIAFLLAQCFDGVFTYVGVTSYGLSVEGNPLIAALMASLGHGPALALAKAVAASLGIGLHLRRIHIAVAVLAAFYISIAIVPWVLILFRP